MLVSTLYSSGTEEGITIPFVYRRKQTVGKGQEGKVNGGSGYDHRGTRASLSINQKTRLFQAIVQIIWTSNLRHISALYN